MVDAAGGYTPTPVISHAILTYNRGRSQGLAAARLALGRVTLDTVARRVEAGGAAVDLTAREYGLLEILMQRPGQALSKQHLAERLCEWGEEVSNNAIEVYIHRLRKKIEKGPVRIATVRGLGYCLEKIPG